MRIKRDKYLNRLIEHKDNGMVKVVTGLRRCGKTYLLETIFKNWLIENDVPDENVLYIALDKNVNAKYRNPVLLDEYLRDRINKTKGRCYCIIDEIQYVVTVPNEYIPESEQTEENAITFYDTILGLMDKCDLYVTGSNSRMLSSDILTNFRGRGDEIRVYPLSFSEYFSVYGGSKEDALRDYLYYGGMPVAVAKKNNRDKADYLKQLFEKTYVDDIVERHGIKGRDDLDRIMDFLASATGSFVNPTNIANSFSSNKISKIARNTVSDYIEYIREAFLINEAKRFDIRGREYISGQQKYYFTDLGLRNARLNFRQFDLPHLLENAVYNELKTRGLSVDVGRVQIRQKNALGNYQPVYLESDFVVNDADEKMYIQVTEGMTDPGKKEQEMRSLLHIRDGFPKYILVNGNVPKYRTEEGIIIMSIVDFLLDE